MADASSGGKSRRRRNPHPFESVIVVRSGFEGDEHKCAVGFPESADVCARFLEDCTRNGWPQWRIDRTKGAVTFVFPTGVFDPLGGSE